MHPFFSLRILPDDITITAPAHEPLHETLDRHGISVTAYCDGMGLCGKCVVEIRLPDGDCPPETPQDCARLSASQRAAGLRLACAWRVASNATIRVLDSSRIAASTILTSSADVAAAPALTVSADRPYGMAIDIGTTTIVASLLDLRSGRTVAVASSLNGQRRFGADVISRINHSLRVNGLRDLHDALRDTIVRLATDCLAQRGIGADALAEMALTGNSVMLHTLHRADMATLAQLPFAPAFTEARSVPAASLGIGLDHGVRLYSFPLIAGFVGGDTVACMLATDMDQADQWHMVIDIGTNTEVALGCRDRWTTASAPAGPAFEGARISCGMSGAAGAIQHVAIGAAGMTIDVIGQQAPLGVCGTGIIDATAALLDAGILDETGRLLDDAELPATLPAWLRARVINQDGARAFILFDPATDAYEEDGAPRMLVLTQRDFRELQLAKAAIAAACDLLLRSEQLDTEHVRCIYLAGAFGNYLRPATARRIGLLPGMPLEKIEFIGNAASTGAKRVLVSPEDRARAERLARESRHLDLAADPEFQMRYAEHMLFPAGA